MNGAAGDCIVSAFCSGTSYSGACPGLHHGRAATAFLHKMGYSVTQNAMIALVGWIQVRVVCDSEFNAHCSAVRRRKCVHVQAEGSPCSYNPLDSTLEEPGATNCNGVGVKNYESLADGVAATAATLGESQSGYADIRAGLQAGSDPVSIGTAIADSAWGTGQLALQCIEDAANNPATYAAWAAKPIST